MMLLILHVGCGKSSYDDPNPPPAGKDYNQVALVTDIGGGPYSTGNVDTKLVNAWGIAFTPTGVFWIANAGSGFSTIYDKTGATLLPAVAIASPGSSSGGEATGIVYNSTTGFPVGGVPAKFIFDTEDGTIAAWASGTVAPLVVDRSATNAVYKGLALAKDGADYFLYAANFSAGTIDVFDKDFNLVTTKPFADPTIPAGFAPFNIRSIGDRLYVTYAKQKTGKEDDEAGAGNGYVNIFNPDGSFVKRFTSQGSLNSPWGIVAAANGFWEVDNTIIIGNFGDGKINVFDQDGKLLGPLTKGGTAIVIDGLWALENNVPSTDAKQLFYTAGPADETHGVFGYLLKAY
jgi:uncharacterized protein (TIGR03118 family)